MEIRSWSMSFEAGGFLAGDFGGFSNDARPLGRDATESRPYHWHRFTIR